MSASAWIKAARLRTLPLAGASVITGAALAYGSVKFSWLVFGLTLFTALLLQILSNFANDYGDFVKGTDNENRVGPERAMQSGAITKKQMKGALVLFTVLCLISGSTLIYFGTLGMKVLYPILFFALGVGAIMAAIKYTVGKNPYGYAGLGDLFVFLFFGLVGVGGSFWLHIHDFMWWVLLPAGAIGLLSAGVLNLNNIRDIDNDRAVGKRTVPVLIGAKRAKVYHTVLLVTAVLLLALFVALSHPVWSWWLWALAVPPIIISLVKMWKAQDPRELDPLLKLLGMATLLISLLLATGIVIEAS